MVLIRKILRNLGNRIKQWSVSRISSLILSSMSISRQSEVREAVQFVLWLSMKEGSLSNCLAWEVKRLAREPWISTASRWKSCKNSSNWRESPWNRSKRKNWMRILRNSTELENTPSLRLSEMSKRYWLIKLKTIYCSV